MISIATDTATLCIYDLTRLKHRKDDVGDWWSIPSAELDEVNKGNVLFMNLGADGIYSVKVMIGGLGDGPQFNIAVPSGRLFVGPGEEVTAGGFEPDGSWGGTFLDLPAGNYRCALKRHEAVIEITLREGGPGTNRLSDLIRI